MGTVQRGAVTHGCVSGVYRPVPAASAKHLFCYLAKTLGFVPFYPPLLYLLLVCPLVLPAQIMSFGFFFASLREQANVEHFGAQKEAESYRYRSLPAVDAVYGSYVAVSGPWGGT